MVYFLSLGSNLGDRNKNLALARKLLRESGVAVLRASSVYETEPVDHLDQPWFLNQALQVDTRLDPHALLELARSIEVRMKRAPTVAKGPRTIDIDILFAGDTVLDTPDLTIPHPRLARRNFVLGPLCEIAPELRHPVLGKTIRELVSSSSDPARVLSRKRKRT